MILPIKQDRKQTKLSCRENWSDLPDSCLIWMVGFETGEVLVVWVWLTLDAPKGVLCCRCLGDCCLGNWARIWAGEPTRVLGEGSLAEATFSPAAEAPRKVNTGEVAAISNLGGLLNLKVNLRAMENPHKKALWQFEETVRP